MGFFDFAGNKKNMKKLEPQPLGYWEEHSYMIVIPRDSSVDVTKGIFEKFAAIEGVTIKKSQDFNAEEKILGQALIEYYGEEYTIGFYYDGFTTDAIMGVQMQTLSESEVQAVKNASKALTIFMPFNEDSQKSYHLQLKLAYAAVPDLAAVMDESAEKVLSGRWVRLAALSQVKPSASSLFSIQAVGGEGDEVWLHTHGLCRCGLTELEIVQSSKEHANDHAEIIIHLASRLLDKEERDNDIYYLAKIGDDIPIVVTYLLWTEALDKYKNLKLGGFKDRENNHNSRTSLIFAVRSENDGEDLIYSKVSIYDQLWETGNPMFFISTEETARMKALAMERFGLIKKATQTLECTVLIKVGLEIDEKYREEAGNGVKEHIWFELQELKDNSFTAVLTQDTYWVDSMHKGSVGEYTVDDVTDWRIFTEGTAIEPETAYLLVD